MDENLLRSLGFKRRFDGQPQLHREWVLDRPHPPNVIVDIDADGSGNLLKVGEINSDADTLIKMDAGDEDLKTLLRLIGHDS